MSIRVPRRAAMLVATAGVAVAAITGGLAPASAWADATGSSSACPDDLITLDVFANDQYVNAPSGNNFTVPWVTPSSQSFSPLNATITYDVMDYPDLDLVFSGNVSMNMDGNQLPMTFPQPGELEYTDFDSNPTYTNSMQPADFEAIPFGPHTFTGEYTGGPQPCFTKPITATFAPPPDGTLIQDAASGQVSVVVGGNRLVLPNPQYVNPATIVRMPGAAYQSLLAAPSGTVISANGDIFEAISGVLIHIGGTSQLAASGLDPASVYDVPGPVPGTFPWDTLPNGTLIHDNLNLSDSVIAGGAQVQFLNWAEVTAAGITSQGQFIPVPDNYFQRLGTHPARGTYVQGDASAQVYQVYQVNGSTKTAVSAPAGTTPVIVSQSRLNNLHTTS